MFIYEITSKAEFTLGISCVTLVNDWIIEVYLTHKTTIFRVHNLISSERYIHPWNHADSKSNESVTVSYRPPHAPGNPGHPGNNICFLLLEVGLYFLEFYFNADTNYGLFPWLLSLSIIFEIHLHCCLY